MNCDKPCGRFMLGLYAEVLELEGDSSCSERERRPGCWLRGLLDYNLPWASSIRSAFMGAALLTRPEKLERSIGAAGRGGVEGFGARAPAGRPAPAPLAAWGAMACSSRRARRLHGMT